MDNQIFLLGNRLLYFWMLTEENSSILFTGGLWHNCSLMLAETIVIYAVWSSDTVSTEVSMSSDRRNTPKNSHES